MDLLTAMFGLVGITLSGEYILWRLFIRKARGMSLPHSLDASALRFFSIRRMRILALAHAAGMTCASLFILWRLW